MKRLALDRAGLARWEVAWTALVLAVLVVIVSLAVWPSLIRQGRDSTVFAYFGFAITRGAVPYQDVWDHKPPLVYAMNALACWLFGPDRVAIWIITTINAFWAALLFFWLVRRLFPDRLGWAWLGTLCFVLSMRHPLLADDGNYTEPYALLPHLAMLLAGHAFLQRPRPLWAGLVGVFAALAAMGRPTFVGSALMMWPAILLARDPLLRAKLCWRWPALMMVGGLATVGGIFAGLAAWGALEDCFDAILVFNWYYGQSKLGLLHKLLGGLADWSVRSLAVPITPLVILSLGTISRQVLRRRDRDVANRTLWLWVLLGFFADLLIANASGRGYGHYFVVIIPQMMLLLVAGALRIGISRLRFAVAVYMLFTFTGLFMKYAVFGPAAESRSLGGPLRVHPVAVYVKERTNADDHVYVWGRNGEINFQAQRVNPVRYTMVAYLYHDWPGKQRMVQNAVEDLRERPPAMIVDMAEFDLLAPLDGAPDDPALQPIYDYVAEHCVLAERIFHRLVPIYHCNGFEPRVTP